MDKSSLCDVIRFDKDFSNASLIVFAFGDDGEYCRSVEGHWLIFAVDLMEKMVYCYCSVNKHPGSEELFELIKNVFIAPHLSFLKEKAGPLSSWESHSWVKNVRNKHKIKAI